MKKAILAVTQGTNVSKKEMDDISRYASSKGAELTGLLEYPQEIALIAPYALSSAFKTAKADIVISDDPMLFIGEIGRDGKLSQDLKKDGIEIYCRQLDMTLEEVIHKIPKDFEQEIDDHIKNMIDNAEHMEAEEAPGVMLFASPQQMDFIDDYIESLREREGLGNAFTIEMDEPTDNADALPSILHRLIKENNIQKIVVVDECHSPNIKEFLKEMKESGMDLVYDLDACQTESIAKKFSSIRMN